MTTKHVNLRLTPEMHSRLVAAAERNHRSLNGEIEWAIDLHLQRQDGPHDEPPAEIRESKR